MYRLQADSGGTLFHPHEVGLFHSCFDKPYNELVHTFHLARDSTSEPTRSESLLFSTHGGSQFEVGAEDCEKFGMRKLRKTAHTPLFTPLHFV